MYLLMALVITHHTTIKYRRAVRIFAIIALLLTFSSIGYPLASGNCRLRSIREQTAYPTNQNCS